jgi:hypothetical protein
MSTRIHGSHFQTVDYVDELNLTSRQDRRAMQDRCILPPPADMMYVVLFGPEWAMLR